ncbi:hypothetical protein SAMN02910384_02670 [Pseudobutyrivibrio sp. ACV-2]|uniref:hypothetical protein n=1 Tax=Pseudobutyrivibrio sp. ACV-2 TaxID=1520801 RepID=UPI0008995429|nr:hypothetical protein [Pseudobutyrivibrio sp. ACV-2]SEA90263.1 hypothetical protein SAMN02910384_02670 [Pseudobutyrivibrio sp. ACV-2]
MAIGRQGNSYAINSGNLPFAAPKKTNTRARDTFHKNNSEIEPPKTPAPIEVAEKSPEIVITKEPAPEPETEPIEFPAKKNLTEEPIKNVSITEKQLKEEPVIEDSVKEVPVKIETPTEVSEEEIVSEPEATMLTDVSTEIETPIPAPTQNEFEIKTETESEPVQSIETSNERNYKNSSAKLSDYTGTRKNTTFAFCDKNDISYIKIKANRLGMTYQDFLAELLLETIEIVKADKFDYTEQTYQNTKTGLKNPVNDRFALKEDFLIDLKQAAANVGMKRSAFVAMCVHKARLSDPSPAWDL